MDTIAFLKGVEGEVLRRRVKAFYDSLTSELDSFGISLTQILQCKLLVVAEEEGRIFGVSGVLKGNYTFVVVKKEYQNRKIGKVLFEKLVVWAPKAGCDFVMGNALASNDRINRIWKEKGGRVLYTSVLGGREHYLQFISFNWRGAVLGCALRFVWFAKVPSGLMSTISRTLRVSRLYL